LLAMISTLGIRWAAVLDLAGRSGLKRGFLLRAREAGHCGRRLRLPCRLGGVLLLFILADQHEIGRPEYAPAKREWVAQRPHRAVFASGKELRLDIDRVFGPDEQHKIGRITEITIDELEIGVFELKAGARMAAVKPNHRKLRAGGDALRSLFESRVVLIVEHELRPEAMLAFDALIA